MQFTCIGDFVAYHRGRGCVYALHPRVAKTGRMIGNAGGKPFKVRERKPIVFTLDIGTLKAPSDGG